MEVYAPMWFRIKTEPNVQSCPKHLFQKISLIRNQINHVQNIVLPVVMRNAYFAHSENILLAMVNDERPHIRELGWRRIKKCRESGSQLRIFKLPKLNAKCDDYIDMIDWQSEIISEPPITKKFTDDEIKNFIQTKSSYQCSKHPLHTRTVKIVSETSLEVCSHKLRDGLIRNRLSSRKRIPKFESKRDYK